MIFCIVCFFSLQFYCLFLSVGSWAMYNYTQQWSYDVHIGWVYVLLLILIIQACEWHKLTLWKLTRHINYMYINQILPYTVVFDHFDDLCDLKLNSSVLFLWEQTNQKYCIQSCIFFHSNYVHVLIISICCIVVVVVIYWHKCK